MKAKWKLKLFKRFKKRKLPIGGKLTVTMTAPEFIGKRFVYTTRKGKAPKRPKRICIRPAAAGAEPRHSPR